MAKQKLSQKYGEQKVKQFLREMLLIRRFEEKAAQMYGLRKIGGFCHLYIGQEAVAVGSISALDLSRDYVVTAYRDHGHAIASGIEPKAVMAELYGKITGCSKGKGGSMHMYDAEQHMFGGNGIVGSQIPVATGVGLKLSYKQEDGVVLCFFGDGAIHQGAFHESMNLAKIWHLPVIFICENNHYGMGTDFRRVSSVTEFAIMGDSYDIPGKQLDGMNVLTVYDALQEAVEQTRNESEPLFFEINTYRYKGHSISDPAKYRTREELESYKQQDPILILKAQLLEENVITEDDFSSLDDEVRDICKEAADFADQSEEPPLEELHRDVLA